MGSSIPQPPPPFEDYSDILKGPLSNAERIECDDLYVILANLFNTQDVFYGVDRSFEPALSKRYRQLRTRFIRCNGEEG